MLYLTCRLEFTKVGRYQHRIFPWKLTIIHASSSSPFAEIGYCFRSCSSLDPLCPEGFEPTHAEYRTASQSTCTTDWYCYRRTLGGGHLHVSTYLDDDTQMQLLKHTLHIQLVVCTGVLGDKQDMGRPSPFLNTIERANTCSPQAFLSKREILDIP